MRTLILGSYVNANSLHVSKLPRTGESLIANDWWLEHGGKGFNVGVALRRLTNNVELLLPIGQDSSGDAVISLLQQEALNTDHVVVTSLQSGFGVGFVSDTGGNFLAIFQGANAHLRESHVAKTMASIHDLGWLYAQLEIPQTTVLAAFKKARVRSVTTILNPSPIQHLSHELISLSDVLIMNENEALQIFGLTDVESVPDCQQWIECLPRWAKQAQWQNCLLIVTLAERGCIALTPNSIHHQSAWPITEHDATGAGDAFNAGLLYGLNQQMPMSELLSFACACGALVASKRGVLQHLPNLYSVDRFIANRERPAFTTIELAAS